VIAQRSAELLADGGDWTRTAGAWSDYPLGALAALRRLVDPVIRRGDVVPLGEPVLMAGFGSSTSTPPTYLAEQRLLTLRHPNPFPRIHLFRRHRAAA
jgi:hypothetical protein